MEKTTQILQSVIDVLFCLSIIQQYKMNKLQSLINKSQIESNKAQVSLNKIFTDFITDEESK